MRAPGALPERVWNHERAFGIEPGAKEVIGAPRPRQREPLTPAPQDSDTASGGEAVLASMRTGQVAARTQEACIQSDTLHRRSHLLRWRYHPPYPPRWPGT